MTSDSRCATHGYRLSITIPVGSPSEFHDDPDNLAGLILGAKSAVRSSDAFVAAWLALVGGGMGLAMATATSAALSELSEERSGVGTAVLQALNKMGALLGTAILGSVLSSAYLARLDPSGLPAQGANAIRQSVFGGLEVAHQIRSPLLDSVRAAFVYGIDRALLVSAGVAVVGVVLAAVFLPQANTPKPAAQNPTQKEADVGSVS